LTWIHGADGSALEMRYLLARNLADAQTGVVRVWDLADLSGVPIFEEKLHDGESKSVSLADSSRRGWISAISSVQTAAPHCGRISELSSGASPIVF